MISGENKSSLCYCNVSNYRSSSIHLGLNLKDSISIDDSASYFSEKTEAIFMHLPANLPISKSTFIFCFPCSY